MQVDIFYQELSYEEIQQNIAFEFLSLLGEIGGFLGLLLGASVLTVCELIDFITLTIVNKFKRNSVRPSKNVEDDVPQDENNTIQSCKDVKSQVLVSVDGQ